MPSMQLQLQPRQPSTFEPKSLIPQHPYATRSPLTTGPGIVREIRLDSIVADTLSGRPAPTELRNYQELGMRQLDGNAAGAGDSLSEYARLAQMQVMMGAMAHSNHHIADVNRHLAPMPRPPQGVGPGGLSAANYTVQSGGSRSPGVNIADIQAKLNRLDEENSNFYDNLSKMDHSKGGSPGLRAQQKRADAARSRSTRSVISRASPVRTRHSLAPSQHSPPRSGQGRSSLSRQSQARVWRPTGR